MQWNISPATAFAILASAAFFEQAAAHCKFIDSWGDANTGRHGQAMLIDNAIPLNNGGQNPWQYDVTVFSDPIVPPVPGHPQWGKRKWMQDGCGATISTSNLWRSIHDKVGWGKVGEWDKNYHWYMNPLIKAPESFVQTLWEASKACKANKVPYVSQGGWLQITVHRVNQDGAGPFRCRIDTDGAGKYSYDAEIITQVSGHGGIECCKDLWKHPLKVKIPDNLQCNIKSGGKTNVCIMRCENNAPNGPFGGCIPFELKPNPQAEVPPPDEYTTPEIVTKPDYGNAGYDVGKGNYRDGYKKRDIEVKWERRNANADPTPGEESEEGIEKRTPEEDAPTEAPEEEK
ncbi:hypothetical protein H072_71 [Dactylellina haptotyla CBS 200.50]|uniref:Uncharacterized protein n=1 Tax=Dactylellina haptotyla (strain CBS 200.50) TaxID=1284197 RepID=S8C2L9_DACHA|nr:hypothetical protein H072_71 [Dactylellina haptotyla CBS 200.50]